MLEWDFDGWLGSDDNKLWLKSEGETENGTNMDAEFWMMYSRNIADFWDFQLGVRHDTQPDPLAWFVLGFNGLAPYFLETEAHFFISEDGDAALRLHQEAHLLLTQRLALQPHFEINLYAQDVPELEVGAGLSDAELGVQVFYELTRKLAPYLDIRYERKFGETSSIAKSHGEDNDAATIILGLKLLF